MPHDGETPGELLLRGNTVMKGLPEEPRVHGTGVRRRLVPHRRYAVVHPDGYIQITDRSKDVIISGGENISSVEVEEVLHRHPQVLHAAVVAQPDDKWGEVPCAFIELKTGVPATTEAEIIAFCRERLAHFKTPRRVVFMKACRRPLPARFRSSSSGRPPEAVRRSRG